MRVKNIFDCMCIEELSAPSLLAVSSLPATLAHMTSHAEDLETQQLLLFVLAVFLDKPGTIISNNGQTPINTIIL